nr:hypothetical protein [Dechloromonas sp.]
MSLRDDLETQLQELEQFAPNAEAVISDPLSELTRKRQLWLLGLSLVCIVLSTNVASLEDASIFGLTFKHAAQPELLFIFKCICAYFTLVFAVGVYQDLKLSHYKTLPQRTALARLALQLHDRSNAELERVAKGLERLTAISSEFASIASNPKLSTEDRERLLKLPMLANAASDDIRQATSTLDSILDKILNSHPIEVRVRYARVVIELVSPVAIAIYAVWNANILAL